MTLDLATTGDKPATGAALTLADIEVTSTPLPGKRNLTGGWIVAAMTDRRRSAGMPGKGQASAPRVYGCAVAGCEPAASWDPQSVTRDDYIVAVDHSGDTFHIDRDEHARITITPYPRLAALIPGAKCRE